jgi:hypothetical protein
MQAVAGLDAIAGFGMWVDNILVEEVIPMLAHLTNRRFWDKKIRIGILALATFIAMC